MNQRQLVRALSLESCVREKDVLWVLKAFQIVLLEAAMNMDTVTIPNVGKLAVRRRRQYPGLISKVTRKLCGLRVRFGMFFNSFRSFDSKLDYRLRAEERETAQPVQPTSLGPAELLRVFMATNRR